MDLNNLRVLHLLKTINIGGIERSVINLSNQLSEEAGFIGIASPPGFYSHENIISKKIFLFQKAKDVYKPACFLANLNYFSKVIKENDINIIHYHNRIFIPYIYLIKLKFPQIKIVHTIHTIYKDFFNNFLKADLFIAVSKGTYDDLYNYKKNMKLIFNGIEINQIEIPQEKLKNFGFVGRFHKIKGIPVLLKAFNELSKSYPEIKLILRGEGGEYDLIKNYIEKHSLFSKVILDKPAYSLDKIYEDIDIIIQPSVSHEGFGLILIEAMQLGIPVITTNLGKLENIIDRYNALIVKPNNVIALKTAMEELLNEVNLYEKMRNNGIRTVKEFYNLNKIIEEYKREYSNLLKS